MQPESPDSYPDPTTPSLRLTVVTNIPAPYRVLVLDQVAATPGIELTVLYAAALEADRRWDLPPFQHRHIFMRGRVLERGGRFIHFNPGIWRELRRSNPDVVLTTGYNPTHLAAFVFALLKRRRHVVMTDGTDRSETKLSWAHRLVRRCVLAGTQSAVVASHGGARLLRGFGFAADRIHHSPLCVNASADWSIKPGQLRDFDLIFSGRLVEAKNPSFAIDVAHGLAARLGRRVRLIMLGHGPELDRLQAQAAGLAAELEVHFAGHVSQAEIPGWFARARLCLFPTQWDVWGLAANEASRSGVPVLVSPFAGVAGELVLDGQTGRVLPLDRAAWVQACSELLLDDELRGRMATAARALEAQYSTENAALGIVDATRQA